MKRFNHVSDQFNIDCNCDNATKLCTELEKPGPYNFNRICVYIQSELFQNQYLMTCSRCQEEPHLCKLIGDCNKSMEKLNTTTKELSSVAHLKSNETCRLKLEDVCHAIEADARKYIQDYSLQDKCNCDYAKELCTVLQKPGPYDLNEICSKARVLFINKQMYLDCYQCANHSNLCTLVRECSPREIFQSKRRQELEQISQPIEHNSAAEALTMWYNSLLAETVFCLFVVYLLA